MDAPAERAQKDGTRTMLSIGEECQSNQVLSEGLRRIIESVEALPTLPSVAGRIIEITSSPETTALDIQRIVSTDQTLTAKILKLVNSSFYAFHRRIGSITEAVVILGFNTIRNLAITCSVFEAFGTKDHKAFDRREFWNHCIAVALLTRSIGSKVAPSVDADELFVMGLLHDIGKLVIEQFCSDDFDKILERVQSRSETFWEAENEVLGATHAEVGRWLCLRWNLPLRLSCAVGDHHRPVAAREATRAAALTHLGNAFCHRLGFTYTEGMPEPRVSRRAVEILSLSSPVIRELEDGLEGEIEQAKEFFSMY